jgi:hypothetical protein
VISGSGVAGFAQRQISPLMNTDDTDKCHLPEDTCTQSFGLISAINVNPVVNADLCNVAIHRG